MVQSVNAFLKKNPVLKRLSEQADQSNRIDAYLKQYLPQSLVPHCNVASFQNGHLTLTLDHATWSLTLRSILEQLYRQLKKHKDLQSLKKITYNIRHIRAR